MSEDHLANAEGPPPAEPSTEDKGAPLVAELNAQKTDLERQLQRLAADFENFRRRAASEREELVSFAASRVLENFLPIHDNFERALAHSSSGDAASILHGIELIYKQIQDFLARQGVAAMEPVGQIFDPNLHEAIGTMPTVEHPDQTVLAVAQKGYFLNGRVLRHAMVQVADNPAPPAPIERPGARSTSPLNPATGNIENTLTPEDPKAEARGSEEAKEESNG
ncbi:MAG: nucleotide exchange factor GrpE [Cyanobacteria bacterium REEB65]|nr:nucleotide exchange factor GrpE [Cyanobacteria bacterium REEB65]